MICVATGNDPDQDFEPDFDADHEITVFGLVCACRVLF